MNMYGCNVVPVEAGSILRTSLITRAALGAEVLIYITSRTHVHTQTHSRRVTDPVAVVVITVAGGPQTETSV